MEHEPSSLDSSLDSRLKPRLNQSALAPMHVSNLDHLFLCARAIMILETSTSSPSFRFSEAKSAHLESSPLSSAASKGAIHEKNNVSVVDGLHRPGWNLPLGRLCC